MFIETEASMKILIDAWLERSEPTLRVWDCEKHGVLLERSGAYLRNLLDQGQTCC